jgi:ATP-binding cassette subfamily C (CFTR/MRP) protein 1
MFKLVGWPAVVGFVITLALAGSTNYLVMRRQQKHWLEIDELKDKRSEKLTEIFQGIRVVKMFTWEKKFQQNVDALIEKENSVHKKLAFLNAVVGM